LASGMGGAAGPCAGRARLGVGVLAWCGGFGAQRTRQGGSGRVGAGHVRWHLGRDSWRIDGRVGAALLGSWAWRAGASGGVMRWPVGSGSTRMARGRCWGAWRCSGSRLLACPGKWRRPEKSKGRREEREEGGRRSGGGQREEPGEWRLRLGSTSACLLGLIG
jgi:hypothetical protein